MIVVQLICQCVLNRYIGKLDIIEFTQQLRCIIYFSIIVLRNAILPQVCWKIIHILLQLFFQQRMLFIKWLKVSHIPLFYLIILLPLVVRSPEEGPYLFMNFNIRTSRYQHQRFHTWRRRVCTPTRNDDRAFSLLFRLPLVGLLVLYRHHFYPINFSSHMLNFLCFLFQLSPLV